VVYLMSIVRLFLIKYMSFFAPAALTNDKH